MANTYVFYRHKYKPMYRLVLKQNAPFPSETSPEQWIKNGSHAEDHVSEETQFEVERSGFKLYNLASSFDELEPDLKGLAE